MWKLCTISQKTECLYRLLPVCPGALGISRGLPLIKTPGLVVTLQSTHQISIRVIFLTCSLDHIALCPEPFHFLLTSEQKSNLLELEFELFQALTFVASLLLPPKYTAFSAKLEYRSFPNNFFTLLPQLLSNLQAQSLVWFSLFLWMLLSNLYNIFTLWWCIACWPLGCFFFLPFPGIPERLLTEGCAAQASIWLQPLESPGRLKEGRRQGISSSHCLPQTVSLMVTVSPLGLQLLSERTFEPSAFADWPWFQGSDIKHFNSFVHIAQGFSAITEFLDASFSHLSFHLFLGLCNQCLHYSPSAWILRPVYIFLVDSWLIQLVFGGYLLHFIT